MLVSLIEEIKAKFIEHVESRYHYSLSQLIVEQPPKVELGDLAFPFCFELAKYLKRPPRQVATEIASSVGEFPGVAKIQVAGPGYINVFLKRRNFFKQLFQGSHQRPVRSTTPTQTKEKIILEHTNINPNKAAHIGHLRNAVLGDTFARLLRFGGESVEVQNYIDDTGVQVADVVVGFKYLEKKNLPAVQAIPGKFDYYCWDLYARVSSFYQQNPDSQKFRAETLKLIEEGNNETAELAHYISHKIVQCHLDTMWRIGIQYDLLPKESDILHLRFWHYAFELLKKTGAIHFETSGKNQGCWIMRVGERSSRAPKEPVADRSERDYEEGKIIVRSNGTVTYVGKDIAYQLWKFGLLGMDFFYHPFYRYPNGHTAYMTHSTPDRQPGLVQFGHGQRVYNVIDSRQSYLQNIVIEGLRALGFQEQADKSTHFSYEMVALSPRCCEELGIQLSEEDKQRPYIEVSGRKGLGVKADDLIDTLLEKSFQEVRSRHIDLDETEMKRIAATIAVSALRYFLLKYTRNSVIAFDFKEALSFEGETGPYVQYAVVRANNIFRKVQEEDPSCSPDSVQSFVQTLGTEAFPDERIEDEFWKLIYLASQLESNVCLSIQTAEPATLAKYLFGLAQAFNLFYHKHRIISEVDPLKKRFLLALTRIIRDQLEQGLNLLGISVPAKM
ncbi:MAG: arginine--tRNA ligase [Acidobacteria bacterium]|nr:MAG: arginine--tRNA ligase [Acidobacteriota bacterium]